MNRFITHENLYIDASHPRKLGLYLNQDQISKNTSLKIKQSKFKKQYLPW